MSDTNQDARESDITASTDNVEPSLLVLILVVARKKYILLVRYWLNTLSRLVTIYLFFVLIFFGGQAVGGTVVTESLDGIIVGYFLFMLSVAAYSGLALDISREAQWGTLERLFMSPHGFGKVIGVKAFVNIGESLFWGFTTLFLMLVTTRRSLHLDPLTVIPIAIITVISVLGIGFFFAGLAVLYKRIENVFQLAQFGFIALVAAPVRTYEILKLIPVTHGTYLMRQSMENSVRLWEFPATELGLFITTSTIILVLGYLFFDRIQKRARRLGRLGHY